MSISTAKYGNATINPKKLTDALKKKTFVFFRGDRQPVCALASDGTSAPSGTAGTANVFHAGDLRGNYYALGTQTLKVPLIDQDKGLEISQDQTDDDGIQYVFGGLGTNNPHLYTVGTSLGGRYIRAKFRIDDVSGTDFCMFGFRKNEAVQGAFSSYADAAAIDAASGAIKVRTLLATVAVNTTATPVWLDDETHEFEVRLIGRRATYFVDGSPLAGIPEFNFANAAVLVPFFFFLQDADVAKVWWTELEIGALVDKSSDGVGVN